MKKVYICSPLGGNVKENLERARSYARYALMCGAAPVVPHFYALCLNDGDPAQRELGLKAGLSLLPLCDGIRVFGDTVTEGMQREIDLSESLNIRIRRIREEDMQNGMGGMIL